MKRATPVLAVTFVILLSGCAAMIAPNPREVAKADYGAYPDNYRELVEEWMRDTLYDPHSIVDLEITSPSKYFLQAAPLMGGGRTYGYLVQVKLNATNRMGGYVGRKTMNILIRNGKVVKSWEEGELVI